MAFLRPEVITAIGQLGGGGLIAIAFTVFIFLLMRDQKAERSELFELVRSELKDLTGALRENTEATMAVVQGRKPHLREVPPVKED